jgi:hypothetical protein
MLFVVVITTTAFAPFCAMEPPKKSLELHKVHGLIDQHI